MALSQKQSVSILYDLAMAMAGETQPRPLGVAMLQRLLAHTGCGCGAILANRPAGAHASGASNGHETYLAVGNRSLRALEGKEAGWATGLLANDHSESLQGCFPGGNNYTHAINLVLPGEGHILLFSNQPLNEAVLQARALFLPILAKFARSLRLCLDSELNREALATAKEKAVAANLAKSTFLANMSHEIRTPMNAILGMAHILQRSGVTPLQADHLNKIDTAGKHLLDVINNILDLSKIEAGKFVIEEAPVAIASLLDNVSSIIAERVLSRGIRLQIECDAFPTDLHGDSTRLQQALLNYAANAVKFSENASVALRALLQEETAASVLVRFEVEDSGIGIAPEALHRLFGAFEQADNSTTRKYGGTGLGLKITQRLAESMGGEVGVASTLGVGSTFWFTARLKKKKQQQEAISLLACPSDAEALIRQRHSGRPILLVDDDPLNLTVAGYLLEDSGLLVDTAENGSEAMSKVGEAAYALILMDMQMPVVDGLQATRQIRQLPGYRDTPIIAMTANAFAEDKARCLDAGMNDFLIKPIDPDQVFAILLKWLEQGAA